MRSLISFPFVILCAFAFVLQGCAQSAVTRDVAGQMDVGYQNASNLVDSAANGDLSNSYQNSKQAVKGAMIGGLAGTVIGTTTTGIGAMAGLASGAVLGGAFGAYLDGYASLRDQLENRHIQVIELGDQIMIVMPSDDTFIGMTGQLKPGAYSTLDLIAKFINDNTNILVKITAYTNATGPERINRSLTQEQANSIEKYLWKRGVNTRLLVAEGRGGCGLVEQNSVDWNISQNYRVEITFEKLPV